MLKHGCLSDTTQAPQIKHPIFSKTFKCLKNSDTNKIEQYSCEGPFVRPEYVELYSSIGLCAVNQWTFFIRVYSQKDQQLKKFYSMQCFPKFLNLISFFISASLKIFQQHLFLCLGGEQTMHALHWTWHRCQWFIFVTNKSFNMLKH